MIDSLPKRIRTYNSYAFDSRQWDLYIPRPDDIVISTSYKTGTTWVQHIVLQLVFLGRPKPVLSTVSPWLDQRTSCVREKFAKLNAQQHRRFIKSHLPLDAIPYYPPVKYIVVGRDARDVFMSFWNHYANFTDATYHRLNDTHGRIGDPMPRCPRDIHECWRNWISRGWFEWESEGYPHSGNLYHAQSWWKCRHLKNILFVHLNDLLRNLTEEIQRIACFLEIAVLEEALAGIAEAVSFSVKHKAAMRAPLPTEATQNICTQGLDTYFFKGTNGLWKDALTKPELVMYEQAKARVLTPDCSAWLEQGQIALSQQTLCSP